MFRVLLFVIALCSAEKITDEQFQQYVDSISQFTTPKPVNPCDFAKPIGITCELHQIVTEDGFKLLTLHLPNKAKSKSVLFVHGLLGSGNAWLLGDNSARAFAFRAWTAGNDVWILNSRGTQYSLTKEGTPISSDKFWNSVDWDFMAKYDIPAAVNYLMVSSPQNKVFYVGHSQGTAQFFAALSQNYDNLQDKVEAFYALAPVARVANQTSTVLDSMVQLQLDKLFALFGIQAFPPFNTSAVEILKELNVKCNTQDTPLCKNIMYDIEGATPAFISGFILDLLGFVPSTTSMRNLQHWMQLVRSDNWAMFDYGTLGNLFYYKQPTPPLYQPSAIKKVKLHLYSGSKDELADPDDVAWLVSQLSPDVLVTNKQIPDYQHNDFLWADTALKLIWEEVLSSIESA